MAYQNVLYGTNGNIATVTMNRPDHLNALSVELQQDIFAAVKEASADDAIKVIILKGAGRAFCAGFDVSAAQMPLRSSRTIIQDLERLRVVDDRLLAIRDIPKPVIAQIHGYCLAGGTMLAAMCDLAVVSEECRIGSIKAPLGAGFVASMWVWLVGARKTKELFYTIGNTVSGVEAAQIGWATKAVPADKLEAEVNVLASGIAETPMELLKLYKLQINRIEDIMGYRTAIMSGCDTDAIAHFGAANKAFEVLVKEKGLKQALASWRDVIK
ncbi:MAG: enoyl-CoA hydratase/isomerase family protein [Chloroflexi bacterium]|nr:enoyl-CoA hydratase/isomerase family protein [Chloroflexota bacterium]